MKSSLRRRAAILAAAACLVAAAASSASAQYFGQNKVQYKKLNFSVLKTEHFDIYFYPEEREGIEVSARLAERWYARLSRIFEHQLRGRQPLVLYASHSDFEQTNAIQGELGEGTGGVTEPLRRRIVLPLGGPIADTDHVIGHELVHAFQFDMTSGTNTPAGENGAERLPLWFIEGMAEYLSIGPVDPNTAMWLRDAARQEKLPAIKDLNNPKYFPYRWGQALWAYVGGRFGEDVIRQMLILGGRTGGDLDPIFKRVLGEDEKTLSAEWKESIHKAYDPILARTTPPAEIGKMVVKASDLQTLNVGPSVSPDGRWLAFLSERSFFSIDLYIADAATGKIVHRLTSNATDPHYSSIQFIYSAGAWDADSKRIAIGTVTGGHPALAIYNAESGEREREITVKDVDELFNPTWAPDGHALCFTGMSQGLTDLWIYDISTSQVRRLTNDAYADLMPAWSPDGRRIAFATDRFSSNLNTLSIGSYRLALIDPASGAIEPVPAFTDGKNINPQWAPDGRSLFFISDRDGIPNLYRVTVPGGDISQLTKVGTGLSGITNSSPALSVASKTGIAAFSVYENDKYDIYTLDVVNAVSTASLTPADSTAAILPPLDRRPSEVTALLQNSTIGLPAATEQPQVVPYRTKLSLDAIGQPTIGVGATRFGAAIGGGVSMFFSDMLGDHSLAAAVQVNQGIGNGYNFNDTAAQVAYLNQAHRWNWGVLGGQIPYLSGGFATGTVDTSSGDIVETDQTVLYRQTERSASVLTAYPFNRARRVEFQGGVTQITFDQIVRTTQYSLITGQLYNDTTQTQSLAQGITMTSLAAAFVSDTSNYGATSPVAGERYRLEAAPNFGTLNFTGLTADYRRYFMPAPFYTLATRVLHYGRYGSGGEDPRLFPLFIGYPSLVRGYDVNTFNASECTATATSSCPAFDRMLGSRLLVGNVEFRFPLLRPFGVNQRMYGPVPVEVAFFADGGVAWNRGERPFSGFREGVSSAGVTLRVNVLGYVPLEFDFSRPFQRPGAGWIFQFNIGPGF